MQMKMYKSNENGEKYENSYRRTGYIGKVIAERLRKELSKNVNIIALGTNSAYHIMLSRCR